MMQMRPLHRDAAPQSAYVRDETVRMTTLERVLTTEFPDMAPVFVKVDAQGYEHRVLNGVGSAFDRIAALQVELSLVELYEGELVIEVTLRYLRAAASCRRRWSRTSGPGRPAACSRWTACSSARDAGSSRRPRPRGVQLCHRHQMERSSTPKPRSTDRVPP